MAEDIKEFPIVETAIALNLICDIIERMRRTHGVEITPDNIRTYVDKRKARRLQLNGEMGITPEQVCG